MFFMLINYPYSIQSIVIYHFYVDQSLFSLSLVVTFFSPFIVFSSTPQYFSVLSLFLRSLFVSSVPTLSFFSHHFLFIFFRQSFLHFVLHFQDDLFSPRSVFLQSPFLLYFLSSVFSSFCLSIIYLLLSFFSPQYFLFSVSVTFDLQ